MSDELTIWQQIAAPLDPALIKSKPSFYKDKTSGERKEGKPIRFIDKTTVEERLNTVCPGDWHFQVTPIVTPAGSDGQWVVKGTLTICGVVREDFGINDNEEGYDPPKAAVSDALKRCAALFGLGRELVPGHALKPDGNEQRGPSTNVKPVKAPQAAQKPASATETPSNGQSAAEDGPARPMTPTVLRGWFDTMYIAQPREKHNTPLTTEQVQAMVIEFNKLGLTQDDRKVFAAAMFGIDSFKGLTAATGNALHLWLKDISAARREAADFLASLQPEPDGEVA